MEGIPDLEERIAQIQEAKRFGKELGLDYREAFTRVDLEGPPMLYWLYPSYRDRIAIPPVRGLVENRSYFSFKHKRSAKRRQRQLDKAGFDTLFFEGEGGGTQDCPITKGLLERGPLRRAYVVLHEGFHINLHQRDVEDFNGSLPRRWLIPYRLNEAIASVVGKAAAVRYAQAHRPELVEDAERKYDWWLGVAGFVNRYHGELTAILESHGDAAGMFGRAQEEAALMDMDWFEPNNAFFLRYIDYTRDTPLVHETFRGVDLRDYLADPTQVHRTLCEAIGEPFHG